MSFSPLPVGPAGTPNTNVVTVQGISGGTGLNVGQGTAGTPAGAVVSVQGVSGGTNLSTALATGQSADIGNVGAVSPYHNVGGGQPNALNILSGIEANTASPVSNIGVGPSHWAPAIVSVGNTQTLLAAARTGAVGTGRVRVTLTNYSTTHAVTIGSTGVTALTSGTTANAAGTGYVITAPGGPITFITTVAIYGITDTSTALVGVVEEY